MNKPIALFAGEEDIESPEYTGPVYVLTVKIPLDAKERLITNPEEVAAEIHAAIPTETPNG